MTENIQAVRVERCRDLIEALQSCQCVNLIQTSFPLTKNDSIAETYSQKHRSVSGSPGGDQQLSQTPRRTTMEKKFVAIIAVSQKGLHYFEIILSNSSVNAQRYIPFLENLFHFWSSQ